MKLGMIGLGRMGGNMAQRLMKGGHECVVYDPVTERVRALAKEGAVASRSLGDMASRLKAPRVFWVMVPAGDPTEKTVLALAKLARPGDILIDGGNSHYKDAVRRAKTLREKGVFFLDCGTSGGVWGAERGYCLMVGGEKKAFQAAESLFETLAPGRGGIPVTPGRPPRVDTAEKGYLHCGPSGAGHFVKMIHNGIEYGLMQSYAEGFDILKNAASKDLPPERRFNLDLPAISELWRRGSVVSSWLLDLTALALAENPDLSKFEGRVPDSGEGRWAVEAAVEEAVPARVLTTALYERFGSRERASFAHKLLSALRARFGGHPETPR